MAGSAFWFLMLPFSAGSQPRVTPADARRLVLAILPAEAAKDRYLRIDLDREHDQCAVYHAYGLPPGAGLTFTLGWFSVDNRTAEVWDELQFDRVKNQTVAALQRGIRKRLRVTDAEVLKSISRPCYKRGSK